MKPIVHGLEEEYGDEIEFVYLDIDDPANDAAKELYGFRFQPHFLLVGADGEIIEQWLGYNSENVFVESFEVLASSE